jgi:hypothetical protein
MGELPDAMHVKNDYTAIISLSPMICLIRDEFRVFQTSLFIGTLCTSGARGPMQAGKRRLNIFIHQYVSMKF